MKILSTICWLAVLAAVVPFLALPLWLTRVVLVVLAGAIFALALYLKSQDVDLLPAFNAGNILNPDSNAKTEDDDEEVKMQRGDLGPKNTDPKEVTSPDADRVARYNSYESRSSSMRSN